MSVGNSGSGSAEHEKCIFVVGKKYWFKYTEDQAYDYSRGKYYAGIVEVVTLADVTWDWCDGEGKKTRKLEELQQEETGELTSEEVLQLQGNCHATRELLRTPTLRRIGGGGASPADRSQTSSQAQGGDSQRPRRATHAPPRYDEETFPSTVQQRATTSNNSAVADASLSQFQVGRFYWFRVHRKKADHTYAGKVVQILGPQITWEWENDKTTGSRDAKTLNAQGAVEMTEQELRHVREADSSFSRRQVLERIVSQDVEGLAEAQVGSGPPLPALCLAGFSNFNNKLQWDRLLMAGC